MLSDKSPTLRGPTCQGVLGLVFHRSPGTSIRPQYMPVKRAECFPFRDFTEGVWMVSGGVGMVSGWGLRVSGDILIPGCQDIRM